MTLKHSNRGAAMPAILALGIFIGASLALSNPLGSRMGSPAPPHIVEAGPAPTPGGGSGEAGTGSCPASARSLDVVNQGYPRAIDTVPERCERNPKEEWNAGQASQASGNGIGVGGREGHDEGGGPSDQSDEPSHEGSEGAEPGDEGSEGAGPGDEGSEGAEPSHQGSEGAEPGDDESEDHGNSGHGDHDPNGNAYGHFDGKGNNS
ncbi:MAG: hypothetical protein ACRDH0_09035 [Actinomycetota bacterium]